MEARFSVPVQTGPVAHPASCIIGTGSFPGVKSGWGVTLTPHPLLVPLVMKEWSYTSTPPMGRTACTEPQCLYKGALYHMIWYICYLQLVWQPVAVVQYTFKHKQYIEQHSSLITKSAGLASPLRFIPWHLPYNWGISIEKPSVRVAGEYQLAKNIDEK
jgi:hypothetical protein